MHIIEKNTNTRRTKPEQLRGAEGVCAFNIKGTCGDLCLFLCVQ